MYLIRLLLLSCPITCLIFTTSGVSYYALPSSTLMASSPQWRFRSNPDMLHLDIPWITPSGFTIGITTNSNCLSRYSTISELPIASCLRRYSAMKEPVVSQGCCRAIMRMASVLDGFLLILRMGTMLLAMV